MQSKNKILIISYYFPPLGGIPPRRSLRFARNLPFFGWQPVVLTVSTPSKNEAAWDYKLLNDIKHLPIEVIRTKWNDILRLSDLLGKLKLYRLRAWYSTFCRRFPPDSYVGWYPYGVKQGMKVIKQKKINCIYSNSAPFTAHLIALKLKKKTGLPWIADFRDPWVDDPLRPKGLFKSQEKHERIQEAKVIRNADHVITTSKNYAVFLKSKYPQSRKQITTIYNGYDWPVRKDCSGVHKNDYLEFIYAGAFYGLQSPVSFLRSLGTLMLKGEIPKDKIRFTIIGGHGDETWKHQFADSPILKMVSVIPFITNNRVREELMKSSCLLLFQASERGDVIVLGKTFEYISTGLPILALVPHGTECASILEQSGCLFKRVEPDSEKEVGAAILRIYESWKSGNLKVNPNWEYISQFEGGNLTKEFVRILERALRGKKANENRA